jgi:hypothetical protein
MNKIQAIINDDYNNTDEFEGEFAGCVKGYLVFKTSFGERRYPEDCTMWCVVEKFSYES